jgi:ABC-type uncharacterized transport system ATPase subunit
MSVAAIETEHLRKLFGDHTAVKGLTLQVVQGEVFGLVYAEMVESGQQVSPRKD